MRWPKPKPGPATPTAPSRSSTKRWRRATAPAIAHSKRNCIAARGEILLKRDPANPAPAEEAFLTAIAVAKQQGARSFGLRAALSLAKLYQSTARPADAHAVLAPALEGFSPTPEMPEIAEAQALLAALAETDEVKAEAAQRQRLAQLHAAYGNALIAARGYGAPETTEAFARARESASGDKDAPERLAADYGLWAGSYVAGRLAVDEGACGGLPQRRRGETRLARGRRRPSRRRASHTGSPASIVEARDHFERALALFQPGRDDDLAFRFGQDPGVAAMLYLALALWPLGEVDRAVSLVDAHAGADRGPLACRHARVWKQCMRPCSN